MTMLLWLGIILGALVVITIGLRAVGTSRWTRMIRTHTTQLESGTGSCRPIVDSQFDEMLKP